MTVVPRGKHRIAGDWVASGAQFASSPTHGPPHSFSHGNRELIDKACRAAEDAFWTYGCTAPAARAAFLHAIADEIEARAEAITKIGTHETGLPEAPLNGERARATGQLRMFARHILDGAYLDRRHDAALPNRQPAPRRDIRMMQRPIGEVAVFGASDFPLAFSAAGSDTASALAAGRPGGGQGPRRPSRHGRNRG
ncbi:MAG: alpha-ketoglutaric semialdehyde dehydrogenase [Paracoccaceae bacterium]|jgi:alpha-ketoglutaric semialdehyde dehydrogenase